MESEKVTGAEMTDENKKKKLTLQGLMGGILLVIIVAVTSAAIVLSRQSDNGGENNTEASEQEGMYTFGDIIFDLPDGYESISDNFYEFRDEDNAIALQIFEKSEYTDSIYDYIRSDENKYYPEVDNITETVINRGYWYKTKGEDGDYLYYAKKGDTAYMIAISPIFTKGTRVDELITTFENSLFIK